MDIPMGMGAIELSSCYKKFCENLMIEDNLNNTFRNKYVTLVNSSL